MADAPLFPRVPFQWHFDLSQASQTAEMGLPDGAIYVGLSGEWGCTIEGIILESYVRPVLSVMTREIGESDPKWIATLAPSDPESVDFYGFVRLNKFPSLHPPLKASLRLPSGVEVYLRADARCNTMMLTWQMTEEQGDFPVSWEDLQSDGAVPRTWEMTRPDFQFMKGCVVGRW